MAYQTGSATNPSDLIDKLRVFLLSIGWTIHKTEAIANGNASYVSHANAGNFVIATDDRTGINPTTYRGSFVTLYGATSFNGSMAYNAQPGTSSACQTNDVEGPYAAYHFFAETNYCHVVVEVRTGVYAHFGFGRHDKAWNYIGGEYIYGTAWYYSSPSYTNSPSGSYHKLPFTGGTNSSTSAATQRDRVRCDIDGVSPYWFTSEGGSPDVGEFIPGACHDNDYTPPFGNGWIYRASPSTLNGLAPLIPILNVAVSTGPKYILVGSIPNMRSVRMRYLTPGQTITIGGDQWMIFPGKRHALDQPPNTEAWSSQIGYAFKKVL